MSSPPAPPDAGDPASQSIFADEILGEIFLRLDSSADLSRVSAACTTFLRVVRFLRRNRSLYRQPVVGFLEYEGPTSLHPRSFYHAEPPHRSASAARDLAEAVDFTCSFLPDPGSWRVLEATGGRLLLSSDSSDDTTGSKDLVVCDPLHRRYVRIPSVPVDLTSGMSTPRNYYLFFFHPTGEEEAPLYRAIRMDQDCFFAPTSEEEGSPFRVIRMIYVHDEMKVTAFVFSSATGQWCRVTFDGWEWEHIAWKSEVGVLTSCRYHPHRSPYRASGLFSEVLMLDTHKMAPLLSATGDSMPLSRQGKGGLVS